ncbi:MAG: type I-E CRISPR-associated protein Cas5/CasD [Chloroflexi bacterium]|nr:type I-E CRISPR-associated protein Cas5/CasD [Chloroflexota bacterium]MCI0649355.1 type I-E CRISPR-associated protein Cas5/CasD [Chloroflexota bacterium]MCI0726652.1 type I-E CRISPR-associated protein Cas5/CasD [Chloroflexota bacterium]
MAKTLFLRLEGPLQSWGERGRWSIRDSAAEPTKSGVIGLIACAMGYSEDGQLRALSEQTRMGVRVDAPGTRLTDYHTIGGGYEEPALLTAEGKPKKSSGRPHTEISERDYLSGASFLVALQSDDGGLIERMAHYVQNPVWTVFLGRKSCPPCRPIFAGVGEYRDLEEALAGHPTWSEYARRPADGNVRGVIECEPAQGNRRRDHIVSRTYRRFQPRYTRDIRVPLGEVTVTSEVTVTFDEEEAS